MSRYEINMNLSLKLLVRKKKYSTTTHLQSFCDLIFYVCHCHTKYNNY